jgi:hypothetical protein
MKMKITALALFLLAVLFPPQAFSQEAGDWKFNLAPLYLWAISIDGDLGVRQQNVSTSIDFGDLWDNLNGVFTLRFDTLYRNKFGLIVDYNYLDLGNEKETVKLNLEAGFKSQILNLAGAYRLKSGTHTWDALAGIRYTALESDITLNNLGARLSGDQDWVDPIVGGRYTYNINDRWALRLYGDIGGFGVSSDLTWQALGMIDFQPWKNVALVAGYRAIYTDYETGSGSDRFSYDATVHGPLAGIDIRW